MTEYKFYREDVGWIDAQPERWQWVAQYVDGTILKQFDDDGIFHQFREIDQSRLHTFAMVNEGKPPFILHWRNGMKLIHFYNNYISFGSSGEMRIKIYCFGYEERGHKMILCIMPDDGIVITDNADSVKVI